MRQPPRIVRKLRAYVDRRRRSIRTDIWGSGWYIGYCRGWEDRGLAEDAEPRELPLIVRMQRMERNREGA